MRSHSHGGVVCEHPTKKACVAARRLAMGKCVAQIEDRNEPRSVRQLGDRHASREGLLRAALRVCG